MRVRTFLGFAGVLGVLSGLPFILFPAQAIAIYGIKTDPSGLLMSRFFGAAFLSFGVLIWYVREAIDPDEHRYIFTPLAICSLVGAIVAGIGQFSGLVNPLGWTAVLIFLGFAIGFFIYSRR